MHQREIQSPQISYMERLKQLYIKEVQLSQKMKEIPLTAPDQSTYAKLFHQLENVRNLIVQLTESIPSAGPSPVTQYSPDTKDPQGKKPWRKKR